MTQAADILTIQSEIEYFTFLFPILLFHFNVLTTCIACTDLVFEMVLNVGVEQKILKITFLGDIGHFGACRKWPKSNTRTDFSAPNHHGGPQQWSR